MRSWIRKLTIALASASTLFYAAGCENMHQQHVKAAEARWARTRANVSLQLAEQQFRGGQMDKALVTLGKAMELDPNMPGLQVLRGQILAEKGQTQQAVAAFELAIALDPQCAEAHYHCGVQLERWGQFEKALDRYQAAYAQAPSNPAYAVAVAEVLSHLDRTEDALELLDKAMQTQEQSVALRVTAGELCQARGDFLAAAGYFRDASRLATGDNAVLRSLAMCLYQANKLDEAKGYLEQLVQSPDPEPAAAGRSPAEPSAVPDRAAMLTALGDCYLASRRADRARDCFTELTRLRPDKPVGWVNMARVSLAENRWQDAVAHSDKALAAAGDSANAHLIRGYALGSLNRPAEAVKSLRAANKLSPKDVLVLCLLSDNYRKLGDNKSARESLIRAIQIAPRDPLATRLMEDLAQAEFGPEQPASPPTVTAGVTGQ